MSAQSQFEREENDICQREADGLISRQEANAELRELQRDYAGAAQEAAQEAAARELELW